MQVLLIDSKNLTICQFFSIIPSGFTKILLKITHSLAGKVLPWLGGYATDVQLVSKANRTTMEGEQSYPRSNIH